MTQYRKYCSDGYFDYLQYLTYERHWLIFKKPIWKYVWRPFCDKIWGRLNRPEHQLFVNDSNTDLNQFIKTYPNIEDYFKWANKRQEQLEVENAWLQGKFVNRRGEIVYYESNDK